VDKRVQPLAEIRELASAESVDAFTLAYTNLLQNHPDCPVRVRTILVLTILPKKTFFWIYTLLGNKKLEQLFFIQQFFQ
jgi:hypothetical protein